MLEGVKIAESKAQKDELILEGTDVQNVSQSGAQLSQFKISFFFSLRTSLLSFFLQPPLSKVFAESETRISESSWTASTCPTGKVASKRPSHDRIACVLACLSSLSIFLSLSLQRHAYDRIVQCIMFVHVSDRTNSRQLIYSNQ